MDVHSSAFVRVGDLFGIEPAEPVLRSNHRRNVLVEALQRVGRIGAFLDPPVVLRQVVVHHVEVRKQLFRFAELFVLPTVEHVVFQQREIAATVQRLFDGVLHLFDVRRLFGAVFFERGHHFAAQPAGFFAVRRTGGPHGLEDRLFDFLRTERGDLARPFYDLP